MACLGASMTWDATKEAEALAAELWRRSMDCALSDSETACLAAALQRASQAGAAEMRERAAMAIRGQLNTARAIDSPAMRYHPAYFQGLDRAETAVRARPLNPADEGTPLDAVETGGPPPEPERTQAMRAVSRRVDELAPPRDHWCPVHDNGWLGDKCLCPPAAPQPRVEEPERCGAPSGDSRHQPCTEKAGHGGSHWHPFRPAPSKGSV